MYDFIFYTCTKNKQIDQCLCSSMKLNYRNFKNKTRQKPEKNKHGSWFVNLRLHGLRCGLALTCFCLYFYMYIKSKKKNLRKKGEEFVLLSSFTNCQVQTSNYMGVGTRTLVCIVCIANLLRVKSSKSYLQCSHVVALEMATVARPAT